MPTFHSQNRSYAVCGQRRGSLRLAQICLCTHGSLLLCYVTSAPRDFPRRSFSCFCLTSWICCSFADLFDLLKLRVKHLCFLITLSVLWKQDPCKLAIFLSYMWHHTHTFQGPTWVVSKHGLEVPCSPLPLISYFYKILLEVGMWYFQTVSQSPADALLTLTSQTHELVGLEFSSVTWEFEFGANFLV